MADRNFSLRFHSLLLVLAVLLDVRSCFAAADELSATKINLVLIYIDDLGYADIGPFGQTAFPTPSLDQMAAEGMKFTDFVNSSAVCSASRAALLTGCYHRRVGLAGALGPGARHGLHPRETTIAELAKREGYATACFGKWHLGHRQSFLPLQHGFDRFYGLPYSNDMWPFHPDYVDLPAGVARRKQGYPDLSLYDGNEVVDPVVTGEDQKQLTREYTDRAVRFIDDHRDRPFLLYVPHSMVHVPLFVSGEFAGASGVGLFGDAVMEIDWSVGQILQAVRRNQLAENTLVVFTSDNGPWLSYGNHAGAATPLREGKGTMWEGGYRVPTIFWWPGRIGPGSKCDELCSTMDILPTFASIIKASPPPLEIDGHDIQPLMYGVDQALSPHREFYLYYGGGQLQGVRDRRWKLVFPHQYRTLDGRAGGRDGRPTSYDFHRSGLELYDLKNDVSESHDVADQYPEIVERLTSAAERARRNLGDTLTNRIGSEIRPAMRVSP